MHSLFRHIHSIWCVWMCVCVHCTCKFLCVYICAYVYIECKDVHFYIFVYVYLCILCVYICVCLHIYVHCLCIYIYIYVYICAHLCKDITYIVHMCISVYIHCVYTFVCIFCIHVHSHFLMSHHGNPWHSSSDCLGEHNLEYAHHWGSQWGFHMGASPVLDIPRSAISPS